VLAAIGLDEDDGGDVVSNHHHSYHSQCQELEVAGEQSKDKSTKQNMNNIEEDPTNHLTVRSPHFHVLPADLKVVMVCAGFCEDEDAQTGTSELVGVEGNVVIAPGDHHDGGLQGQLQGRLR